MGLFESSNHTAITTIIGLIILLASWPTWRSLDPTYLPLPSVLAFVVTVLAPIGYWKWRTRKRNLRYYSYGDSETREGLWGEQILEARFRILYEWFKQRLPVD